MRLSFAFLGLGLLGACGAEPQKAVPSGGAGALVTALAMIRSDSIALPADEETFGEGAEAALLNGKCLACHSVTMIRFQPPLDRKQWTATVDKMREAYRAPIEPGETEAIVDALMAKAPSKS